MFNLVQLGQLRLTPRVVVGHSFGGKGDLFVCSQITLLLRMNRSEMKI